MNKYLTTRRNFLKQTSVGLGLAGLAMTEMSCRILSSDARGVSIVTFENDAIASTVPPQWALTQLKQAFESLGVRVRFLSDVSQASVGDEVVVVAAANHSAAQQIIAGAKTSQPGTTEALFLGRGTASGRSVLLVSGSDARGLVYALLELTDRLLYSDSLTAALEVKPAITEQPHNRTRSMCRSFQSEVEDKPWFNDRSFWTEYLSMLAAERFNRFNLCLGLHYNSTPGGSPEVYLFFAYPFLVEAKPYPGVPQLVAWIGGAEHLRDIHSAQDGLR